MGRENLLSPCNGSSVGVRNFIQEEPLEALPMKCMKHAALR